LVTAPTETLSPSNLGGAKALSDERGLDTETALQRGQLIHLLLEHLPARPESDWPVLATHLLSPINQACGAVDKAALLSEATALLTKPDLRRIFTTEALAEVDVSADLPSLGGRRIHGTIDRLVIDKAEVLAIDFKSNVAVPSEVAHCPEGILRQMAAYAEALQQIYPDHKITMAILWTKTATLMLLPDRLLSDALSRADVS
jgi:ATP-dependent helicase/nuclease subunit A